MKCKEYIVILTTASAEKEAYNIAKGLLNKKLAACVNILPKLKSYYWWNGRKEKAEEHMLMIKTEKANGTAVADFIKKLHSYDIPEIIEVPIMGGSKDYLDWITQNVSCG